MPIQDPIETAPKYREIGQEIGAGFNDVQNLSRVGKVIVTSFQEVIAWAFGWFLTVSAKVGVFIATTIIKGEDQSDAALSELSAVAVSDLLNVDINPNVMRRRAGRGAREAASSALGTAIIKSLVGNATSIEPSDAPAGRYVANVTKFGMEGWLSGWTMEFLTSLYGPFGHIETFGELDDILAQTLGFGRLSRRVLGPYVDALVVTPTRWNVNKTYRPELLAPSLAVKMFTRKRWTREQLFEELARQGYSDDRIEALMQDAETKPAVALVLKARELHQVDDEYVRTYLAELGYTDAAADFIIGMQEVEAIDAYEHDIADAAAAAYVARRIPAERFYQLLSDSGLHATQRNRIRELAELKRAVNVKPLNESDAEAAAKRHIISIPEYRSWLRVAGYTEDAIYVKELLLQDDIRSAEQTARAKAARDAQLAADKAARLAEAEKRKRELEAERAVTEPSLAMVERFVTRGRWDFNQYETFLRGERYEQATIDALLADAQQARVEYVKQLEDRANAEARAATRTIGLADLEDAVMRGYATIADYRRRLTNDKYTADDQALLVNVLQDRINDQKELEDRRRLAEQQRADKGLSVAQFEDAVLRGVQSMPAFDAFLANAGYGAFDRSVIVQLAQRKLDDQAAAARRRAELEKAAAARAVPVDDIRRAVVAGVRTLADYRNALIAADIPSQDRVLLEDLLKADLTAKATAEERRRQIEAERASHGLSLSQLERAVIAGAATVEQYQDQLADEGYNVESIDALTALILERITETQRARLRREELDNADRGKKISPAQMAAAVRAGLRTTTDYYNALLVNGNTTDDAELLTELLELEILEAAEAKARRDAIAAELAVKHLSLGELARAVRKGERTLEQYGQALRDAGYVPADVSTLVAMLDQEIDAAAAARQQRAAIVAGDASRELSLSQFERGVLAGIRTLNEYAQFVESLGYTLDAQATLVQLLQQQLDKNAGADEESQTE